MNEMTVAFLDKNKYAVLSTVREDGSPWASPVHFAYDETNIYWLSSDDTIHSINIARDDRVFITIFNTKQSSGDTDGEHGALYVSTNAERLEGDDASKALAVFNVQHPDAKSRKLGDWSAFRAPIGELNPTKTSSDRLYYRYDKEHSL
jgi:nitroimidazol reductase NimA-like FMN-containing flavoprotein (pyridoxamine 5'-phosphate oxidase superfamily)